MADAKPITLATLRGHKRARRRFPVVTAYDATFARLAEEAGIEVVLVGDSVGNVCLGHRSTVPVTMADMVHHTAAVARGVTRALVIADLPYMSYATPEQAFANAAALMQAGAQVVKLEGGDWLAPTVRGLAERGVPVCGHLGLTPQSVDKFGGYRVQGRDAESARRLLADAEALVAAGADLLVLECVPRALAAEITQRLPVPVIGIGAGPATDAQVLVLYDLLGISPKIPSFARDFLAEAGTVRGALQRYAQAVREGSFPGPEHGFD
ncbi:MAG: 3-methyl-2-oxobutanoate hydroxymethyltransferase [Porticoccaceae bacterium]|nr:MAG: 3-methyl-2-oxobutanoate hydroxymethyltransferase [Porticoccaceae bacterium]